MSREQLERTKNLMNKHARDALISGYEYLVDSVNLPDKGDNHVLAAAIHGDVDVIVTYNLNDFPGDNLVKYNLGSQHPDTFLTHLIDLNQPKICQAVKKVRERLTNPEIPVEEYFRILEKLEPKLCDSYA
ncbi:MAG: hypothetical protein ACQEP7_04735 [bacterium]